MTLTRFILITFFQWLFFLALKLIHFKFGWFGGMGGVGDYIYFILVMAVAAALVRRLGVINFLEAIMVLVLWLSMDLLLDLLITAFVLGLSMFGWWQLWAGYFFMVFVIFFFHKKRHVHIRHEQKHAHH